LIDKLNDSIDKKIYSGIDLKSPRNYKSNSNIEKIENEMLMFLGNDIDKRPDFYSPRYEKNINFSPINKNEIDIKTNKDIIAQVDKKMDNLIKKFGKPNTKKHSKEKINNYIYENNSNEDQINRDTERNDILNYNNLNIKKYNTKQFNDENNLNFDYKYMNTYSNKKFK